MQKMKDALEDISKNIKGKEELVNKVENELVELNPSKKLKKRDKELLEMDKKVGEAIHILGQENSVMNIQLKQVILKLE